jgi:hypothetical protein
MTKDELQQKLDSHKKWLAGEGGERLDSASLADTDLSGADLVGANLSHADLRGAYLSGADLSGADLDYSSGIPLDCGGSGFTASIGLLYQYLAHLCTIKPAEGEEEIFAEVQAAIRKYALRSHRAECLGLTDDAGTCKEPKNATTKTTEIPVHHNNGDEPLET